MKESLHIDSSRLTLETPEGQLILKIEGITKDEPGEAVLYWPRHSPPLDIARELLQKGFAPLEERYNVKKAPDPKLYLLDTLQPTKTHPETIRYQYIVLREQRRQQGRDTLLHHAHALRCASLWLVDSPDCNPYRAYHLDERREENSHQYNTYPKSERKRQHQEAMREYIAMQGLVIRKRRAWIGKNSDVWAMDVDDITYYYGKIKPSQDLREPGSGLSFYHRSTRSPVWCLVV